MSATPPPKGCTSEKSGERCPCPQFVLGGKDIRFLCVNCGHREAEHAPCSRKQYQFGRDQVDGSNRCLACGLDVVAHVAAEHAPCSLTPEYFQSYQGRDPILVNGRCSACGLDVGRHWLDREALQPARRMRVDADPDSMYLISFSVPNGTSLLHFRTHAFRIAAECHAFRRGDEGRGNCITYTGDVLPYALSFELYFKSEDQALEFIRRIYGCLPGSHPRPSSRPCPAIVSVPSCMVQLLAEDHQLSARRTPRDVGPQSPLTDHMTQGSPSESLSVEDIAFEALFPADYFTKANVKAEGCHIVPKRPRKPHNRLVMNRTLHSWFDGTAQMTAWRMPSLFISLGEGRAETVAAVPGRVFLPIRLHFSHSLSVDFVLREASDLVRCRQIGGSDAFPSQRIDASTFEVWVGFLDGGKAPDEVRRAVRAGLATRPRPDQVAPAPLTALELDQSPLTDDEGDEAMG